MKILYLIFAGLLFAAATATAEFDWAPLQPVGSTFPEISATAPSGEQLSLGEIAGERGTLLFFNRSTDW